MPPVVWHFGKGKIMEIVKRSIVAKDLGAERSEWINVLQDINMVVKLIYDSVIIKTWHYTFFQTHRMYNAKSKL